MAASGKGRCAVLLVLVVNISCCALARATRVAPLAKKQEEHGTAVYPWQTQWTGSRALLLAREKSSGAREKTHRRAAGGKAGKTVKPKGISWIELPLYKKKLAKGTVQQGGWEQQAPRASRRARTKAVAHADALQTRRSVMTALSDGLSPNKRRRASHKKVGHSLHHF